MTAVLRINLLSALVAGFLLVPSSSFLSSLTSTKKSFSNVVIYAKSHPEYSFGDEEDQVNESNESSGDYFSVTIPQEKEEQAPSNRPEYGALSPGTVVQVQVGDISLARKAWKKRRRTGSPLLVPCSVLNVDRQSMVRWNLIFLLEKFGRSQKDGIEISSEELSKKYRTFLQSSLQKQANALEYDSNTSMIKELFNKKIQEAYGVRLVEKEDELLLKAPISRHKAHKRTARTPILQFRLPRSGDHGDSDTLTHTGYVKARKESTEDKSYNFLPLSAALRVSQKDDVVTGRVEENSIHPAVIFDYDLIGDGGSPLLTLTLNPNGIRDTLKVKPDRRYTPIEHPRCTFDQLSVGDGPFSAKVVKLLPGRALVDLEVGRKVSTEGMVKVLGTLRFQDSVEVKRDDVSKDDIMMMSDHYDDDDDDSEAIIAATIDDLDMDDFDDDDDDGNDLAEELLSLRADSSFEEGTFEEGEEEEDISHLFKVNDDGSLTYDDPESGESMVLNTEDEEEDDEDFDDDMDEDISSIFQVNNDGSLTYNDPDSGESIVLDKDHEDFADLMSVKAIFDSHTNQVRSEAKGFQKHSSSHVEKKRSTSNVNLSSKKRFVSKRLRVGDDVDVYVRSISKQSGQFAVTTNPDVQGRKAKDLKKESDTDKKLKRLKKSLGGNLDAIYNMKGEICDGTVKATSKTGDWVYVQPEIDGLPVGVATLGEHLDHVEAGDSVRVRINGVDEQRGQLALQVVDKLAP